MTIGRILLVLLLVGINISAIFTSSVDAILGFDLVVFLVFLGFCILEFWSTPIDEIKNIFKIKK